MKPLILPAAGAIAFILQCCTISQQIPFRQAEGYFVLNTVPNTTLSDPKISTKEEFDRIFGAAATMGPKGMPTAIDFSKEYVIAAIEPETNRAVRMKPRLVQYRDNNVNLVYLVYLGDPQTFTSRPALIVVVPKEHQGPVQLSRIEVDR